LQGIQPQIQAVISTIHVFIFIHYYTAFVLAVESPPW
jgi:hypothetical protein